MTRRTLLACLLALAACTDAGTGVDVEPVRYALQSVNGASLPTSYLFRRVGITVQATSGFVQMNSDATFAFSDEALENRRDRAAVNVVTLGQDRLVASVATDAREFVVDEASISVIPCPTPTRSGYGVIPGDCIMLSGGGLRVG